MSIDERLSAALSGRYRIERELGEGGMAKVYLAEDLKHGRRVALKVLKPELAAVVGADRFLAEIKTTANLQHPHILPLFDSGEADGFLYYVMPYVEGETLRERLDRDKQLPVDEAVGIATAVAGALETAHTAGVVHRDIKPANVLLSRGQPLVADFGIAIAVSAGGGGRLTETGMSLGTPYYMSPEQATGDQTVGPGSDVYALGCVLYEMLVGDPPYVGSTAQAVLGKILQGEAPSATASRATIPANVDAAIGKALEKLPADRFRSAADFARALSDPGFRRETGSGGGGADRAMAASGFWARVGPVTAVVAVVLGVLAAWGWMGSGRASVPTVRVPMELSGRLQPRDRILVTPDGRRLVMVAEDAGVRSLWTRALDESDFHRVPGTEGARNASLSPDGEWVAYADTDFTRLMKVYLLGGAPTEIVVPGGLGGRLDHTDWADDDSITVVVRSTGRRDVKRVDASGGQARLVGEDLFVDGLRLLPGGRHFLGTHRGPETQSLVLVDRETGRERVLREQAHHGTYVDGVERLVWLDPAGTLWVAPFDPRRGEITGREEPILDGVWAIPFGAPP